MPFLKIMFVSNRYMHEEFFQMRICPVYLIALVFAVLSAYAVKIMKNRLYGKYLPSKV